VIKVRKQVSFKVGDLVTRVISRAPTEIGIVKHINSRTVISVVYNCDQRWNYYHEYNAQATKVNELIKGWPKTKKHKK